MDVTQEIKDRLSIDEVVGEYVQLRQAGANFKGLCPFHNEKTPSFVVSPDKGIFHCFGCGAGGDMFTFVEKIDGLEFREALELLATKANVELPARDSRDSKEARTYKQRLREALDTAAHYYHIQLARDRHAKDYIEDKRGFKEETIKVFKLGYAPKEGDRLVKFMRKQSFSEKELLDAGLARKGRGLLSDMFRNRVVIPFYDAQGQVIGFTGRSLGDGLPKYLNTPQTSVFDKSRFVFGLYQSKDSIRKNDEAVISEGNLDVLSSYQAGVKNTVAVSGTALTLHQLKTISRISKNVTLAFDADEAGVKATERAIPISQVVGINLSVVALPAGKDPDDIIRAKPEQWKELLAGKKNAVDWLIDTFKVNYDLASASGKRDFTTRIGSSLRQLKDSVEQDHFVNKVAKLTGVAPSAVEKKVIHSAGRDDRPLRKPKVSPASRPPVKDDLSTVADALLCLSVTYSEVREALNDVADSYLEENPKQLLAYLKSSSEEINADNIPDGLMSIDNYVKILLLKGEEEYGSWALLDRQVETFSLTHRLKELQTKRKKQHISSEIAVAEAAGDDELRKKLLKEYQQLSK